MAASETELRRNHWARAGFYISTSSVDSEGGTGSASDWDRDDEETCSFSEGRRRPSVIDPYSIPKTLRKNQSLELFQLVKNAGEAKVLVIYTGGTIGMVKNQQGVLAPVPNALEAMIRRYPHLHDEVYASKHYGKAAAVLELKHKAKVGEDSPHSDDGKSHLPDTPLALPETREKKRVVYTIFEYEPLLDSSNITMDDYIRIASDIKSTYHLFDGFVILHGTDTLCYTASALSFMLENLGKSVILTGSQIPIFETRSDGRDNFIGALILAGNYVIPEVTIFFNHKLFRGNRTTKMDTGALDAFDSPNLPPLANFGITIRVNSATIFRPTEMAPFHVHPSMSSLVGLLRLFPSMSLSTVKAFLSPPILGVVLQTYGAGNMPSNRTDILEEIQKASARGVIVLNVTQCPKGGVDAYYATGKVLLDAGVIPGADLTAESALAKLSYVLSKEEWDHATKKKKLQQNLRGELTLFDQDQKPHEQADLLAALGKALHVSSSKELDQVKEFLFPCVLCAAAKTGDISKIKNLIKHGADVSSMDYDSRTALHIACSEGNTKVARYLLSKGASVHVRDRNDRTPLMDAIKYGHVECVQVLVQCGACLNPNNADLATLVSRAVADENMKVLEAFKLAGADFNVHDPGKRTPLHLAVFLGKKEVVQFLLAAGASTATLDDLNMTPVQIAKRHERRDLVELLSHFDFKTELPRLEAVAAGAAEH